MLVQQLNIGTRITRVTFEALKFRGSRSTSKTAKISCLENNPLTVSDMQEYLLLYYVIYNYS